MWKTFATIKVSLKWFTLLSLARINEIKIDYNLLPVILSNCGDLQTIQRSGNIDFSEMFVLFSVCRSEASFGLMPHRWLLATVKEATSVTRCYSLHFNSNLTWISSGTLYQSWLTKTGQELLVQCGTKRLEKLKFHF